MSKLKIDRNTLAAIVVLLLGPGALCQAVGEGPPGRSPPAAPAPQVDDNNGPQGGERRPPPPPGGVDRAVDELSLTDEQKRKVEPIVDSFKQKEREARTEFLRQMKDVLTSDQYQKLESSMRRPPGPRPRPREDDNRPATRPAGGAAVAPAAPAVPAAVPADGKVAVTFEGGYETDPRDGGRPVVLVASALNVPTEVFRKAFSGVTPASGGREPEPAQVGRNKQALLRVLGPYNVTNDRLDTVSNFYRYQRGRGEMWRNAPASAYATVKNGKVIGFVVTDGGYGYSSPPRVVIQGMPEVKATAVVGYSVDFKTNGTIKSISIDAAAQ